MKKIPTAKKYLQGSDTYDKDYTTISLHDAEQRMIEFAKMYVEAALKEASEKFDHYSNKNVVLNSYSLEKIK